MASKDGMPKAWTKRKAEMAGRTEGGEKDLQGNDVQKQHRLDGEIIQQGCPGLWFPLHVCFWGITVLF